MEACASGIGGKRVVGAWGCWSGYAGLAEGQGGSSLAASCSRSAWAVGRLSTRLPATPPTTSQGLQQGLEFAGTCLQDRPRLLQASYTLGLSLSSLKGGSEMNISGM